VRQNLRLRSGTSPASHALRALRHRRHPEGESENGYGLRHPTKTDDDLNEDSIEELKSRRNDKSASAVDVDEFEQAEGLELPGADLSNEELAVRVLPKQQDEFTCMSCFLVHHRSQLAAEDKNGNPICRDCAA